MERGGRNGSVVPEDVWRFFKARTRELWGKLLFPFKDVAPSLNSAVLGAPEGTSFAFEISIFTSIL